MLRSYWLPLVVLTLLAVSVTGIMIFRQAPTYLDGDQLRALFAGRTLEAETDGVPWRHQYLADGSLRVLNQGAEALARWRIVGDRMCWDYGATQYEDSSGCWYLAAQGSNGLAWFAEDGTADGTSTFVYLQAVPEPTRDPPQPPGSERTELTYGDLTQADQDAGMIHNGFFAPVGPHGPPRHQLQGAIRLRSARMQGFPAVLAAHLQFPGFDVRFLTQDGLLIPAQEDIIHPADQGSWSILLSPGRVWSEEADRGMSRAAFPFLLTKPLSNESHNGIASFLYDDTRVSSVRFQIVEQSSPWTKFDAWGVAQATYEPGPVADAESIRKRFATARGARVEVQALATALASTGEGDQTPSAGSAISDHISSTGILVDDRLYLSPCRTGFGDFPLCHDMRRSVFGMSTPLALTTTLLRLAEVYGPEIYDLKIADYLYVSARHDGWRDVTFGDALNMATGIGDLEPRADAGFVNSDSAPESLRVLAASTAAYKLRYAFRSGNYPWEPGRVFRFRTQDSLVLGAAMENFYRERAGADADLWEMMHVDVLEPIGIHRLPVMRTRERLGRRGTPILAYGLYPTVDDLAKIARLLLAGGRQGDVQLLHAGKTQELLRPAPDATLSTGIRNDFGEVHFGSSLWLLPYRTRDGCAIRIPAMSGLGGSYLLLLPNKVAAFRLADAPEGHPNTYDPYPLIRFAEKIRPLLPAGTGIGRDDGC